MPPFNAYPATIIYTETAPDPYTAIGTLAKGSRWSRSWI